MSVRVIYVSVGLLKLGLSQMVLTSRWLLSLAVTLIVNVSVTANESHIIFRQVFKKSFITSGHGVYCLITDYTITIAKSTTETDFFG